MNLLAIVEVEKEKRVYCPAAACTKTVYKQIHIVAENDRILVLGSKCYSTLCGTKKSRQSQYTGSTSRKLTAQERELLADNTAALIKKFEEEKALEASWQPVEDADAKKTESLNEASWQPVEYADSKTTEPPNFVAPTFSAAPPCTEVLCSYCRQPMSTTLAKKPARGFRCTACDALSSSGITDRELMQLSRKSNKSR